MDEVKKLFRPEFLNRIDETIVFHPLTKENIKDIVGILFNQLSSRMQKNLGIILKLGESGKEYLAKEGFDELYGARPLKRAIQQKVEDQLAEHILDGRIKEGDEVEVNLEGDNLTFTNLERE